MREICMNKWKTRSCSHWTLEIELPRGAIHEIRGCRLCIEGERWQNRCGNSEDDANCRKVLAAKLKKKKRLLGGHITDPFGQIEAI
jgi:hypothetical protein